VLNYADIFHTFIETVWDLVTQSVKQSRNLDTNVC